MTSPQNSVTADLNESKQVVLDGSGNGIASLTPSGARYSGYSWQPDACFVQVSTNTNEASATAYVSYGIKTTAPTDAIGQTISGSTGDTCAMNQTLRPGDWLSVKWAGGDAGAIATMRVTGKITIPIPVATE